MKQQHVRLSTPRFLSESSAKRVGVVLVGSLRQRADVLSFRPHLLILTYILSDLLLTNSPTALLKLHAVLIYVGRVKEVDALFIKQLQVCYVQLFVKWIPSFAASTMCR